MFSLIVAALIALSFTSSPSAPTTQSQQLDSGTKSLRELLSSGRIQINTSYAAEIIPTITPTTTPTTVKRTSSASTTSKVEPKIMVAKRPQPKPQTAITIAPVPAATVTPTPSPISIPTSEPIPVPTPTPTDASASVVTAGPQEDFVTNIENEVLRLTNIERTSRGLRPLSYDAALAQIARAHSADMIARNYFSHTNTAGCDALCRLNNAGYGWQTYAENIHWMSGQDLGVKESAQKIVDDWMNSAPHKANILNASLTHAGVGISREGSKFDATALYSVPR